MRDQFLQQLGNDAPEALRAEDVPIEPLLLELAKRRWPSGPDAPLSTEPHWVLAQRPFQIFVTATPDRLLFEALGAVGKQPREELFQWNEKGSWPALIRDTEPSYEPTQENPLVYYLFGRHDVPHSLVITEDDYFDYLIGFGKFYHAKDDIRLFELINTKLTEWSLLFLGFEMDGWDSRVLFRSIMGPHRATLAGDYDVARAGVQLDLSEDRIQKLDRAREYLRDYFSKANIHLYWGSVEDFARDLQQRSTGSP